MIFNCSYEAAQMHRFDGLQNITEAVRIFLLKAAIWYEQINIPEGKKILHNNTLKSVEKMLKNIWPNGLVYLHKYAHEEQRCMTVKTPPTLLNSYTVYNMCISELWTWRTIISSCVRPLHSLPNICRTYTIRRVSKTSLQNYARKENQQSIENRADIGRTIESRGEI